MEGLTAEVLTSFAEDVVRRDWQNHQYKMAPHHREWFQQWLDNDLTLILAARGHGKTETIVVLPILWLAVTQTDKLIYLVSSSLDQAEMILERIKTMIERGMPWLMSRDTWQKQQIKTTTRVTVVAKGACNRIIGPHPQYIFVDDLIEDKQTIPDSEITKWFLASLKPMLAKGGKMLVVGTYKHFGDIYHTLQEKELFAVSVYPAIDEMGKLLWPGYWSQEMIDRERQFMGTVLFAREYMLQPVDESSSMFPMQLITECYNPELSLAKHYEGDYDVYVGVDPAASGSIGADYTVFCIIAHDGETDKRILLDLVRERGMTLQQHIDTLRYIDEAYKPARVMIEKNAFQRWLEQEASLSLKKMPISGHNTGKEKSDLREGIPSLRLAMEKGMFVIPRGTTESESKRGVKAWDSEACKTTEPLVKELNAMTWEAGKITTVAKHDDTVMALWLCNMAIEEGKMHRGPAIASVDTSPGAGRKQSLRNLRRRY